MKITLQFLFMMLLSIPALAQTSAEKEEQEIKDLISNSFQEIFSENKQDRLLAYYTEDFLLLENGEVWDMDIIRNYMEKAAAKDRTRERINSFEFIETKISGNTAWTAYHNKAVFKVDGKVVGEMNWLESATAIRTAEGWKLQMLHSTVVENEEKKP